MSRTHLYRSGSSGPARPMLSIVLAAAWLGAGLLTLLATLPSVPGGLPLHGPAAAVLERTFALLAGGAVIGAVAILLAELFAGRTTLRGIRLLGAVLLLAAGAFGSVDTARRMLRPGTPVTAGAGELTGSAAAEVSSTLTRERLLWCSTALLASALVLGGGLAALRSWDHTM